MREVTVTVKTGKGQKEVNRATRIAHMIDKYMNELDAMGIPWHVTNIQEPSALGKALAKIKEHFGPDDKK